MTFDDDIAPEPVDTDITLADLTAQLGPPAITRKGYNGGRVYTWFAGLRHVELTVTGERRTLVDWTRAAPPTVPASGLGC